MNLLFHAGIFHTGTSAAVADKTWSGFTASLDGSAVNLLCLFSAEFL